MNWAELLGILLISTVRMCTPITLAAVGGVFSARSGVMALGLEGFMLMGAFGAAWGSFVSQNALVGLLCGVALSAFYSLIFALLCVVFSVNQVICGIGMNLFASGFTASMTQLVWGTRANSDIVPTLPHLTLPLVGDLSPLIPLMLVIVAASWFYLFRTPWGLRLRIVGENTPAAKSIGINAVRYKFLGVAISGVLCGLAGSFLSIDHVNRFVREMTAGRGFIAVAVNILGRFNPALYVYLFRFAVHRDLLGQRARPAAANDSVRGHAVRDRVRRKICQRARRHGQAGRRMTSQRKDDAV